MKIQGHFTLYSLQPMIKTEVQEQLQLFKKLALQQETPLIRIN